MIVYDLDWELGMFNDENILGLFFFLRISEKKVELMKFSQELNKL